MTVTVKTLDSGLFAVIDAGGHSLAGPFETNAQAWAVVDALLGDRVPAKARKKRPHGSAKAAKLGRKSEKAARKAPAWLRTIGATKFDRVEQQVYRDHKLGTFGPASQVRKISVEDYLKSGGAA